VQRREKVLIAYIAIAPARLPPASRCLEDHRCRPANWTEGAVALSQGRVRRSPADPKKHAGPGSRHGAAPKANETLAKGQGAPLTSYETPFGAAAIPSGL
jgi:hypothetical protein